jgi:hypothetical protein
MSPRTLRSARSAVPRNQSEVPRCLGLLRIDAARGYRRRSASQVCQKRGFLASHASLVELSRRSHVGRKRSARSCYPDPEIEAGGASPRLRRRRPPYPNRPRLRAMLGLRSRYSRPRGSRRNSTSPDRCGARGALRERPIAARGNVDVQGTDRSAPRVRARGARQAPRPAEVRVQAPDTAMGIPFSAPHARCGSAAVKTSSPRFTRD